MTNKMQKAFAEDGQLFVRAFGLLAKVGKIKLDMVKMRKDRENLLKAVGVSVHQLYHDSNRKLESNALAERVGGQLAEIQQLEQEIDNKQKEISRLQADFRQNQMKQPPPPPPPPAGEQKKK